MADHSRSLSRSLSNADRGRLDEYFTSVRELERRLHSAEEWEYRPKPKVASGPPEDIDDAREFVKKTHSCST